MIRKPINAWCLSLVVVMGLMVGACVSKKTVATGETDMSNLSDKAYLKRMVDNAPTFDKFSAKMRLELAYGSEKISVGGSIKMKRDEAIQFSLVAVGIVEAARIEFTPKRLLVLDRISRRYVEVKYDDLPFFKQSKLDFYTLQALFWNELFLPGVKHVEKGDLRDFQLTRNNDKVTLTVDKGKRLSYSFLATLATGILEESRIHVDAKDDRTYQLNWLYQDFTTLEGSQFPASMNLSLKGIEKPTKASFNFSRWNTEANYTPLTVPNRYRQVEAADILKQLLTL